MRMMTLKVSIKIESLINMMNYYMHSLWLIIIVKLKKSHFQIILEVRVVEETKTQIKIKMKLKQEKEVAQRMLL